MIVAYLPQGVAGQSNSDDSKGLACAALDLDGVAASDIDAPLTQVQIVTRQSGDMPGFGAVEVDGATERKLMSPIPASNATASARCEAPRWCIERVAQDDVRPG